MGKRLLLGSVAVVALLTTAVPTSAISARRIAQRHPTHNTAPSKAFETACSNPTSLSPAQCAAAAVPDFNAVRSAEGVRSLRLPRGFNHLSAPFQLFVLTNLERIDRGLPPFKALAAELDHRAKIGARNNADPTIGHDPALRWGANWSVEGESPLFDTFCWMYSDGPGAAGCVGTGFGRWEHRGNILGNYQAPLLMGAATAPSSPHTSMTALFVGGAGKGYTLLKPHWSHFARRL